VQSTTATNGSNMAVKGESDIRLIKFQFGESPFSSLSAQRQLKIAAAAASELIASFMAPLCTLDTF
jgi:formate hydrogenlyase subunit 4